MKKLKNEQDVIPTKTLIIFDSWFGNTEKIAAIISPLVE